MRIVLNRASSVYLCVCCVFAAGIWLTLQLGSVYLAAPLDLAGRWRLTGDPAGTEKTPLVIHQSGRYFRFVFASGPPVDLVLSHADAGSDPAATEKLTLLGQGWRVLAEGPAGGDIAVKFTFDPPASVDKPWSGTYRRERLEQSAQAPLHARQ